MARRKGEGIKDTSVLANAAKAWLDSFRDLVKVLAITLYLYFYWPSKEGLRSRSRTIAQTVCSISLLILLAEVALKLSASPLLDTLAKATGPSKNAVGAAVIVAILVLLLHSVAEMRHAHVDQRFAESMWTLHFFKRPPTEKEYIQEILKLTVRTFEKYGAFRACIWVQKPGGLSLHIPDSFVFPKDFNGLLRELHLNRDEGVACKVHTDRLVRYSPRLSFELGNLSFGFLHSISFEPVARLAENDHWFVDVETVQIEPDSVTVEGLKGLPDMKSFISVPITIGNEGCLGVLCIDFRTIDPLGKVGIKAATSIGFSIGAELTRFRSAGPSGPEAEISAFPESAQQI